MSDSVTMTIRLDSKIKHRLDRLAKVTRRSRSYLAAEAVQEFVALNEWQIREIENAVAEADASDFASDEEVRTVLSRWGANGD